MVEERSGLEWTDDGILGGGGEGTRKFSKFPKPRTAAEEGVVLCVLTDTRGVRATCQFLGPNGYLTHSIRAPILVTKESGHSVSCQTSTNITEIHKSITDT